MKKTMKAQKGATVSKKPVKKKPMPNPNDDYKNMKDPKTGKKGKIGGEGTRPPFTPEERKKMPKVGSTKKAKSGLKVPKPSQKGLKKLPTAVRNKMGYAKKGKSVMKAGYGNKTMKAKMGCSSKKK
jgi:hypothetical protein